MLDRSFNFIRRNLNYPPSFFPGSALIIIPIVLIIAIPVFAALAIRSCFNFCFNNPRYNYRARHNHWDHQRVHDFNDCPPPRSNFFGNFFNRNPPPPRHQRRRHNDFPLEPSIINSYGAVPAEPVVTHTHFTPDDRTNSHFHRYIAPRESVNTSPFFPAPSAPLMPTDRERQSSTSFPASSQGPVVRASHTQHRPAPSAPSMPQQERGNVRSSQPSIRRHH